MATDSKRVAHMVEVLRRWQGIERQSMNHTAEIIERTPSSLVRLIMEIIRHDSMIHHRVQQFLIDSVTREGPSATSEDTAAIWDQVEALKAHDEAEQQTLQLAESLAKEAWDPIHKLMIEYLLVDEKKHHSLLEILRTMQAGVDGRTTR